MPQAVISDWQWGPMGPGFFIFFPQNRTFFYDGAPLPGDEEEDPTVKRDVETLALMMLLRNQCR